MAKINQPTICLKSFIDDNGVSYLDTYLDDEKNIAFIFGVDSVSQTVQNAISLWKGEYQYNITLGIPWLNILGNPLNKLLINTYIRNAVLNVNYVTKIISIDYIQNNIDRKVNVIVKYENTQKTVSIANAFI